MLRRSLRRISKDAELRLLRDYPILTWEIHAAMIRCWLDGEASYPPLIRADLLDGLYAEPERAESRAAG